MKFTTLINQPFKKENMTTRPIPEDEWTSDLIAVGFFYVNIIWINHNYISEDNNTVCVYEKLVLLSSLTLQRLKCPWNVCLTQIVWNNINPTPHWIYYM